MTKINTKIFFLMAFLAGHIPLSSSADEDCGEVNFHRTFPKIMASNTKVTVTLNPNAMPRDQITRNAIDSAIRKLSGATSYNVLFAAGPKPSAAPYIELSFNYEAKPFPSTAQNVTPLTLKFTHSNITVWGAGTGCWNTAGQQVNCFDPTDQAGYAAAMEWVIIHELLHSLGVRDSLTAANVASGRFIGTNNSQNRDMKLECVLNKIYIHTLYCG